MTAYAIVIVGVGGTGSFVACDLARYLSNAKEEIRRRTAVVLVDGDHVEEKNRARQMYYPEDVGRNKAECLCQSINDAYGTDFLASESYLEKVSDIQSLLNAANGQMKSRAGNHGIFLIPVIISCVDNVPARIVMENFFEEEEVKTCIYIDSGNGYSDGQCVYAVKDDGIIISPTRKAYGFQFLEEVETRSRSEISCEELNQVKPQHILANRYASLNILSAVFQMLEEKEIVRGMTIFNAFAGMSTHHTPEDFGFAIAKKEAKKRGRKKTAIKC